MKFFIDGIPFFTKGRLYVTTDWHLGHGQNPGEEVRGIILHQNRPFSSYQEMDGVIINNINDVVKEDDWLFNLGDLFYPDRSLDLKREARAYRSRIHCKNLVVVWGNHDKKLRRLCGRIGEQPLGKELFRWADKAIELEVNGILYYLSHYPHLSWDKSFHGSRHLFGHVHGMLDNHPDMRPYWLSLDACVEKNDYRPLLIPDDVEKLMIPKVEARNKLDRRRDNVEIM